jgi:predicted GNAT family N-acyltransferase
MQEVEIEISPTGKLSKALLDQIYDWLRETFVEENENTTWSDVDWHVLVRVLGKLVSHVEIVERIAQVDGRAVELGGIGGVMTLTEWRGRGLSSVGMQAAQGFMCEKLGVEFGLLLCDREIVPFYEKLGWTEEEGPLVYDQPHGKVTLEDVFMVYACSEESWPGGLVDLCGYPW